MSLPVAIAALLILSLIRLLPFNPKTTHDFNSAYDYIIVGAGSAGSVVASRLSEDPCVKVLLLEAGPEASLFTEVPAFASLAANGEHDWNYTSVPQKRGVLMLKDQKVPLTKGRGLGGTSLLNYMLYTRGNKRDYDTWAKQGATGWAWKDVLPYFLKSEDNTDPEINNNGHHSRGGYLKISSVQYKSNLMTAFAKAAAERGYEYIDINGEKQTGYSKMQGTVQNGRRCSTSKAFLLPTKHRENLDIITNALVTKVLIDDNKEAYGVAFEFNNQQHEVRAAKEVIISAGTFNSPKILMLSGIGPRDHLEQLGLPVIVDLPVGENMEDHVGTAHLHSEATKAEGFFKRLVSNSSNPLFEYNMFGTGIYSGFAGVEGFAFINSKFNDPSLDWPDIEIHLLAFTPAMLSKDTDFARSKVYNQVYAPYAGKNTFTLNPIIMRPKSRGTVRLASTNPRDYPLIDPNAFQNEEDLDLLVEGMKECVNIVTKTNAFKEIEAKMFQTKFPGCENHELYSEDYLRCIGTHYTSNAFHSTGTCRMGNPKDKTAVVDPKLRVINIKRLRVVDGSVMPKAITGNTNAPIIMIGEKASDMIKENNLDRLKC